MSLTLEQIEEEIKRMDGALDQIESQLIKPLTKDCHAINHAMEDIRNNLLKEIDRLKAEARKALEIQAEALREKKAHLGQAEGKHSELAHYRDRLARARAERIELEQARNALALLEERWAKMLIGAPWREWAKDHQMVAAKQLTQQKTMILADDMGLGKTLSAIMALDFIKAATVNASPDNPYEAEAEQYWSSDGYITKYVNGIERPSGLRALYLCPSSLIRNVVEELRRWAPHRSVVPIGAMPKAQQHFAMETADEISEFVMVLNYEAWRFDKRLITRLAELNFDTIILDEAHNFKDTSSETYLGIKKLMDEANIGFRMPMTGTPILNKADELYPLLHLVDPVKYPTKSRYLNLFCRQDHSGKWRFKPGGEESLRKRLGKKYLRRTAKDAGIVLPKQDVQVHEIPVIIEDWPKQAEARKSMRNHAYVMLGKTDEFGNPKHISAAAKIAIYTRLRQIETWPAGIKIKDHDGVVIDQLDVEESQKLDYIINKENEGLLPQILENGHRVVLFSQFTDPLKELQRRIEAAGYRVAMAIGETTLEERHEINHDFDRQHSNDDGSYKFDVVLCNYRVGGVGLNFTAATHTIIVDEEWNPGKRDQAYGRTNRIGQTEETQVHVLRMTPTIDDWLAGIMDEKEKIVDGWEQADQLPDLKDYLDGTDESGLL